MNFKILASGIPIAVFFGLSQVASPWIAIVGGFSASSLVYYASRRDRLIGEIAAFAFVCVAVTALVGIVANSEKAYLASGPVSDFLFVPWYLGSVLLGRPLVGGIARELAPALAMKVPLQAPVFAWLSVAWAGFDTIHGTMRVYLLTHLSVGEYIVWSRLIGWPITGALLATSAFFIWRAARSLNRGQATQQHPVPDAVPGFAA